MLASGFLHEPLPSPFVIWRGLAQRLFPALCHQPNLESASTIAIPKPSEAEWSALADSVPPMKGLEYLNGAVLARLWDELEAHVRSAMTQTPGGAAAYGTCARRWLRARRRSWSLPNTAK